MFEESPATKDVEEASGNLSPGEMLAQARDEKGLSRLRVSELLGLTQGAIRDIELGRFDKFPSGIYTRGYIRNYSKLVGADEVQILAAYDRYGETHETPEEAPFGHSISDTIESTDQKKIVLLVAGVLAFLLLLSLLF